MSSQQLTADEVAGRKRAVWAASVASISGLMFGWDAMALNVVKKALVFHTNAGPGVIGFAISFGVLTAVLGAFVAGRLSDVIGRRIIMRIAALLFFIASVGTIFIGHSMGLFLFWRFFSGLAMGASMTIAPAYVSETSPADMRGRLVSLRQFFLIIGLFVCGFIGDWLIASAEPVVGDRPKSTGMLHFLSFGLEAWQWAFLSVAVGGLIYLISALFIPESPRYLVARGKESEALRVLTSTLGSKVAQERFNAIKQSLATDEKSHFKDLLNHSGNNLQKIVWIGIGLAALQQLVGINAIFYYSTTIWSSLGFGEQAALQKTLILTAVKVCSIIFALTVVDRLGRRFLLLVGSILMSISLIVTAVIMLTAPHVNGSPNLAHSPLLALVALLALCIFVFGYAGTWGAIMWVMVGEMFPNRIRGAALSVGGASEWTANYIVTLTFPILAVWSIGATYVIYSCFALLSIPFVLKFVPETRGKELEDMDNLISEKEK